MSEGSADARLAALAGRLRAVEAALNDALARLPALEREVRAIREEIETMGRSK